jgi:putative oxygen-independent coproporphyrinogen III oxidase
MLGGRSGGGRVPSTLPEGESTPADGALPDSALIGAADRPLGVYIHVPFCATRCGYCDFNTYTATELGGGTTQSTYAATVESELDLAVAVLGDAVRPVETVFFGGGTPTLLPTGDLARMLDAVRMRFGLAPTAEVTTESNPESVDKADLARLRQAGFNRISFGLQSAREHVLGVLDRQHSPGRVQQVVRYARDVGFEHINVDLIYGTPGESDDDWRTSLDQAVDTGVDHVSAYSLIVEPGTRLAARISRGELPMPDDDGLADRYEMADAALTAAGFDWYEVSNWARTPSAQSRHNLLYWTGGDWWGFGPGAHSHHGGVRWWNVKHPSAYAQRLAERGSPAHARELLDPRTRHVEDVMLRLRLRQGLPALAEVDDAAVGRAFSDGLLDKPSYDAGRLVLTLRGRLLADAVVRDFLG